MFVYAPFELHQAPGSLFLSIYVTFKVGAKHITSVEDEAMFVITLSYTFSFLLLMLAALGNSVKDVYVTLSLCVSR